MTDTRIFWIGVSLALFAGMNLAANKARRNQTWTDEAPAVVGYAIGLVTAVGLFFGNSPKVFVPIGVILFGGTGVHIIYCWIECWPSTIKRRKDAEQRSREAARARQHSDALQLQQEQHQAELARRSEALSAIAVGKDGVTNIAKQIVAELARANP
jgi:hypothetical protein